MHFVCLCCVFSVSHFAVRLYPQQKKVAWPETLVCCLYRLKLTARNFVSVQQLTLTRAQKKTNGAIWAHSFCSLLDGWYTGITQYKCSPNFPPSFFPAGYAFLWFTKKQRGDKEIIGGWWWLSTFSFLLCFKSPAPSSYLSHVQSSYWCLYVTKLDNLPGSGVI